MMVATARAKASAPDNPNPPTLRRRAGVRYVPSQEEGRCARPPLLASCSDRKETHVSWGFGPERAQALGASFIAQLFVPIYNCFYLYLSHYVQPLKGAREL
jgi:hypothetical protein